MLVCLSQRKPGRKCEFLTDYGTQVLTKIKRKVEHISPWSDDEDIVPAAVNRINVLVLLLQHLIGVSGKEDVEEAAEGPRAERVAIKSVKVSTRSINVDTQIAEPLVRAGRALGEFVKVDGETVFTFRHVAQQGPRAAGIGATEGEPLPI